MYYNTITYDPVFTFILFKLRGDRNASQIKMCNLHKSKHG